MAHESIRDEIRHEEQVEESGYVRIKKELRLLKIFENNFNRLNELVEKGRQWQKKGLDDVLKNRLGDKAMSAKKAVKHNSWKYLWVGVFKNIHNEDVVDNMMQAILNISRLDKKDILLVYEQEGEWKKIEKQTKKEIHNKIASKLAQEEGRIERLERRHSKFAQHILPLCAKIINVLSGLNDLCGEASKQGITGPDIETARHCGAKAEEYIKALQQPSKQLMSFFNKIYKNELKLLNEEKRAEKFGYQSDKLGFQPG